MRRGVGREHARRTAGVLLILTSGLWHVWPPAIAVVVPLLVIGTVAYWTSGLPVDRTVLPIGLNRLARSMIVRGEWRWPSEPAPDQT